MGSIRISFARGLRRIHLILGQHMENPIQFTSDQLLLTYGTRGMEPLRGFPEFMRAAAVAQQRFPELQVMVFGNDRSAYSDESPHPSGSWKDYMLEELKDELDFDRLHFTGLFTYGELVQLFRRSDLALLLYAPLCGELGCFQAAACGAQLLVNDFPGLDEVFAENLLSSLSILIDQDLVTTSVIEGLAKINSDNKRASSLAHGLDLASCLDKWSIAVDLF